MWFVCVSYDFTKTKLKKGILGEHNFKKALEKCHKNSIKYHYETQS